MDMDFDSHKQGYTIFMNMDLDSKQRMIVMDGGVIWLKITLELKVFNLKSWVFWFDFDWLILN